MDVIWEVLDITGEQGARYLGILREAKVSAAIDDNRWRLGGGRSRIFEDLIMRISEQPSDSEPNIVLWKHAENDYHASFSVVKTWEQIRIRKRRLNGIM